MPMPGRIAIAIWARSTTSAAAASSSASEWSGRPYWIELAPRPSPWPTAIAQTPALSSAAAIGRTWSTRYWCAIACEPSRSVVSTNRTADAVIARASACSSATRTAADVMMSRFPAYARQVVAGALDLEDDRDAGRRRSADRVVSR